MLNSLIRRAALASAVAVGSLNACHAAEPRAKTDLTFAPSVSVITQPSETRKPSFPLAGIIRECPVKDGDRVKAGQILMKQDTDLDEKEAARLKIEAESTSRIEAATADMKVKQIEYDRKSKAPNSYAASEIEEAEAKLIEAQKSVKVAEEDHEQAKIKHEQELVRISKMEMLAPSDGDVKGEWIVQHVVTNVGEMADPQSRDGAIQIVKNDPLYVEIRGLTTLQVSTLKKGEKLQVRYLNDKADAWKEGEIFFIAPVAQADADRQVVKLKLPNPEGRDSGMRMELNYPKKLRDTAPKDDAILSGGM